MAPPPVGSDQHVPTPPAADSPGGAAQRDGGRAWSIVAVAFAAMFCTFGIAYSFGAFLLPLGAELEAGRGATAGVFSLTAFAFFSLGALSGPALDRFGPRPVLLLGAGCLAAGLLLTAGAGSLWQAYLGHGVGVGLAVACTYVPMVALVGQWFERRRTMAVGVAVSGIGLGTLLVAPLSASLIEEVGWRDAYRVLAAVGVAVVVACAVVVRPAPAHAEAPPGPLGSRLRSRAYVLLYAGGTLLSVAMFVPFVHLPAYAESRGVSPVAAAGLIGLIGASSVVGRLALSGVAHRFGVLRTYQGCYCAMAASFALWLGSPGYPRLVAFAVLLGVGYGGFVALGPAVVAEHFGIAGLGALLGVLYTSAALGSAVGPPVAGALITATDGYAVTAACALAIAIVSTVIVALVPPVRAAARS